MARRRFFVDEVRNGMADITGDEAHHLTRVLRVEAGQRYEISDNRSVFLAEVETARKDWVVFRVLEPVAGYEPNVRLALFLSLVKFDRFELAIEKATELGVHSITPVESERTEKGLAEGASKRMERWHRILVESSQQARRVRLPTLHAPVKLADALHFTSTHHFLLDEQRAARPLFAALPEIRQQDDPVALLVGPEGGWTDHERAQASALQWRPVSLGPNILRTETAAAAALAVLVAAWAGTELAGPRTGERS
jgi:16S rRNA (uracil1498-N3)-methyltransferase